LRDGGDAPHGAWPTVVHRLLLLGPSSRQHAQAPGTAHPAQPDSWRSRAYRCRREPLVPLYEDDVREGANDRLDQGVDHVVVVTYLHSHKNGEHEHRTEEIATEIIETRGVETSVMLSSESYPTVKQSERLNTTERVTDR
jgi:N-methylhydantoinase A/oxoprolinase/acetone carboxylase beta subunit